MLLVCGNTSFNQNVRIVGGIPAVPNSWPAQIQLLFTLTGTLSGKTYQSSGYCGGTLINRYTVLTAAHCLPSSFEVTLFGQTYTVNVTNIHDPTKYTVYVGAQNNVAFSTVILPTIAMAVKTVIRVSIEKVSVGSILS